MPIKRLRLRFVLTQNLLLTPQFDLSSAKAARKRPSLALILVFLDGLRFLKRPFNPHPTFLSFNFSMRSPLMKMAPIEAGLGIGRGVVKNV